MKNLGSNLLLSVAIGALLYAVVANPPGGIRWGLFLEDPSPWLTKAFFIGASYVWPAMLAFLATSMFQMQFRLSSSGAPKRAVFSICVLASGTMLLALRAIAFSPNAGPSYVAGMAAGYTTMSRLYAVRIRAFGKVRLPWPIWRGDRAAVEELHRAMQARGAQVAPSR